MAAWHQHSETEFFLASDEPEREILAQVIQTDLGFWLWEAYLPSDLLNLDMDGWWGRKRTRQEAQEAVLVYFDRYGVRVK